MPIAGEIGDELRHLKLKFRRHFGAEVGWKFPARDRESTIYLYLDRLENYNNYTDLKHS